MIDRLRFLLDRPLDPLAARAMVVFATAILLGFAALFVLGAGESGRPAAVSRSEVVAHPRPARSFGAREVEAPSSEEPKAPRPHRQDPQDEKGSSAAGRAAKAMRSHRALQHIPYRSGPLAVRLIGARGDRAVLVVSAPTISAAHLGWRRFLRRYRDGGRAYLPRFKAEPRAARGGE
jgi:hypothetical protein